MHNPAAVMLSLFMFGGTVALSTGTFAQSDSAATAPAGAVQIARPFNKAVVRESVPIKLRDFPVGGYVAVSIDGKFITAQALPKSRTAPVYVWDTKATYIDPASPDTPQTYTDGAHAITIAAYTAQNKLVGQDSVSVQLANKINLPASQGIKLVYPWKTGLSLRYQRRTTLTAAPTEASTGTSVQVIQQSLLRFGRSVENVDGATSLLRDEVISVDRSARPKAFVSYVATHGQSQALTDGIRAKYREVDDRGRVLSSLASQNNGNSIGFSIPVLPPRRVSVGAHWESPVQLTLDWTSPYPATVTATSTLEDFEWQDRYPTAKIRETYAGPATFYPGPGSALPAITSQDIKFERVVYFAYNAGRVVRTQTTISLTSNEPGLLNSAAGPGGFPGGFPGPGGFGGRGNRQRGGYPGGFPGGPPGGFPGGPPPGAFEGPPPGAFEGPPPGAFGGPPPGAFGGYPGGGGPSDDQGGPPGGPPPGAFGGYPGGGPGGYPGSYPGGPGGYPGSLGQGSLGGSPTKLTYSETAVLLT